MECLGLVGRCRGSLFRFCLAGAPERGAQSNSRAPGRAGESSRVGWPRFAPISIATASSALRNFAATSSERGSRRNGDPSFGDGKRFSGRASCDE